jgi:hypothetical protein
MDGYSVGALESPRKRTRKRRSAGPVTIRRADGTVEERPAYSESRVRQIVGHDRGEEREYGMRTPRQTTVGPE